MTLLNYLFGMRYHQYTGLIEYSTWKKTLIKVITAIQKSIDKTITVIDADHRYRLDLECKLLKDNIKNASSIDEINEKTILGLIKLVFYLIGERPNNSHRHNTNNNKYWELNSQRQLLYFQTNKQKFNAIINNAPKEQYSNSKLYNQNLLIQKFQNLNRNFAKFVAWHQSEYPIEHLNLF